MVSIHEESIIGVALANLRATPLMPYKPDRGTVGFLRGSRVPQRRPRIISGTHIMQFRSLLVLGFCATFALNASANAGALPITMPSILTSAGTADVVPVAAPKADAETAKKKKLPAKSKTAPATTAKAKAAADKKAADAAKAKAAADAKKLAKAKADEAKKLAQAKAEKAKKLAQAKAEKEKLIAEKAKAAEAKRLAYAKAAEEKKIAYAKAAEERKLAKAKADEERKLAMLKAQQERQAAAEARAKAAADAKLAKAQAAEQKRLAIAQAAEERRLAIAKAAEEARQAEIAQLTSMEVVQTGNNGELRSESAEKPKPVGLFAGIFGGSSMQKQSMLPETRALDAALELREAKKKFKVRPEFEPQEVEYSGYPRGTIVIDTAAHYLYLMEGANSARRYAIAVGKDGLQYKGTVKVADKQEWPRWIPTKEMQQRDPAKYGKYADGMPGGGQNPLGARAIYLYENGKDTHLRIHGTIAPESLGTNASNGCFRMINEHVIDLYRRVPVGTNVVVI